MTALQIYKIEFIRDRNLGIHRSRWVNQLLFSCGALIRFRVMATPYGASRLQCLNATHLVGLLWMSDQPDPEKSVSGVLWVAYATHRILKPVPALPR